jgi:hypothetical protein
MAAISETAASYKMLNSQLLISQKGGSVLFFAAGYGGRLWNQFQ